MAVVIGELVVRARTGDPPDPERRPTGAELREDRARLVEEVVEEVMRLMRREQEP